MRRKSNQTQITPEIQAVLNEWQDFAARNNIRVAPPSVISDIAFKANVNVENGGHCICDRNRPTCPCPQCLTEVQTNGLCF